MHDTTEFVNLKVAVPFFKKSVIPAKAGIQTSKWGELWFVLSVIEA